MDEQRRDETQTRCASDLAFHWLCCRLLWWFYFLLARMRWVAGCAGACGRLPPKPVVFVEVGCLLLMGSWSADQVHHTRVEYTSGRAASSPIIISSGRCGEISSREQPDLAFQDGLHFLNCTFSVHITSLHFPSASFLSVSLLSNTSSTMPHSLASSALMKKSLSMTPAISSNVFSFVKCV